MNVSTLRMALINRRNVLPPVGGYPLNKDVVMVFLDDKHTLTKDEILVYGVDNLAEKAVENMHKDGTLIVPLGKVVGEEKNEGNIWLVTSRSAEYGAANILLQSVVDKIRQIPGFEGGFYVIPSSINEVLVLPKGEIPVKDLAEMVKDVNAETVRPDEFLSDYVMEIKGDCLEIAE